MKRELLIFFRSLAVMLNAGIPLHEGVRLLSTSTASEDAAEVYKRIGDRLAQGMRFSDALALHPRVFDRYLVGLIKVGESSGTLARILVLIADGLEKSWALRGKLQASLTYPCILVAACLLIVMVAPSWLLEGHLRMLRESGVALPFSTRVLMLWSKVLQPPVVLALLVAGGLALKWLSSQDKLVERLIRRMESTPVLGRILRLAACARFSRALAVALRAGVGILEALKLSAQATGNKAVEEEAEWMCGYIMNGASLGEAFTGTDFFLPGFAGLVEGGEAVGKTPVVLELGARFYELELELAIASFTTLLEPLLLLLIGIITACLLTAVLQPTLSLLQSL